MALVLAAPPEDLLGDVAAVTPVSAEHEAAEATVSTNKMEPQLPTTQQKPLLAQGAHTESPPQTLTPGTSKALGREKTINSDWN